MNPQEEPKAQATAEPSKQILDKDLLRQILEENEATNRPFGSGDDYTEEDALALGLPPPRQLNFLNKFVRRMVGTPFVPKWMYEAAKDCRTEEERLRVIAGTMLACVIRGREMGFKALESTEVFWKAPDGRLGLYAKPMTALMLKAGAKIDHLIDTDEEHSTRGTRQDGNTYTSTFTHEDIVRAGLWDKDRSNHRKYPRSMLKWRTLSDLFNTLFPDLSGNGAPVYTAEELQAEFEGRNGDRGDNSDSAFREQGIKNSERDNPYPVGRKSATPPSESGLSNPSPVDGLSNPSPTRVPEEANTPATPRTGEDSPKTPATPSSPQEPPAAMVDSEDPRNQPKPAGPVAVPKPKSTPDNIREMPKPSPALDLQPQPPEPQAIVKESLTVQTPKPAGPLTAEWLKKEWLRLSDLIPAVSPESLSRKAFPEFTRGFLNIGKLPASSPEYGPAIAILESILKNYQVQFNQSPHGVGAMAGASWQALKKFVSNWPEDCRDLAYAIAIERYPYSDDTSEGSSGSDMIDYLNDPAHVEMLDVAELRMFLVILMKTRLAMKLQQLSVLSLRSMCDIVLSWRIDLEKATEAEILALIERDTKAAAAGQGVPAPAADPMSPVTPPSDEDDIDSLFAELEDEPNA